MEKNTKVAKFEGGPLSGDAIELPAHVTEHKTIRLETIITSSTGANGQRVLEREEVVYEETPKGSGYFVCKE